MKIKVIFLVICILFSVNILNGQTRDTDASLCAIEASPDVFLEKMLDVRAVYVVGFEMGWLEGVNFCKPRQIRIAYKFDENYNSNTNSKVLKRFNKTLTKKNKKSGNVRRVQGVFRIQIKKHVKKNETENLYDYDIDVLKIVSVE